MVDAPDFDLFTVTDDLEVIARGLASFRAGDGPEEDDPAD